MNLGGGGGGDGGGGGGGGGFNPAGAMVGMAVGGAMGGQMARMMKTTAQNMPTPGAAPPPIPQIAFNVVINGQNSGPFGVPQLQQLVQQGQMGPDTQVWKAGMASWAAASMVPELSGLFSIAPPPSSASPATAGQFQRVAERAKRRPIQSSTVAANGSARTTGC